MSIKEVKSEACNSIGVETPNLGKLLVGQKLPNLGKLLVGRANFEFHKFHT